MFFDEFKSWQRDLADIPFDQFSESDVERALSHERPDIIDFLALLSPKAQPFLEQMAQKAHRQTLQNFGRSILLFTPLYLANFCSNQCVYCSYNIKNNILRRKLRYDEVEEEAKAIAKMGLQHLLLLTGESRKASSPEYIADCARILRPYFASLGIEVYPLETQEYRQLYEAGIDTLTIYQEVYDEEIYASVHLAGPKRVHRYRLEAPERACEAGLSGVTLGALLGLGEWRKEAFFTGLHAAYLQKNYPEVEVAVSAPRMRPHAGSYKPQYPITDAELVQILLAYRLFMPRAGITLSTRESASMRDALLPLGITKLSAGSLTSVGGYSETTDAGSAQFEVSDERSVEDIVAMLRTKGYQPVFCDWVNVRDKRGA